MLPIYQATRADVRDTFAQDNARRANETAQLRAAEQFGRDVYERDTRGDASVLFAMACAPAVSLSGLPANLELLNAQLLPGRPVSALLR